MKARKIVAAILFVASVVLAAVSCCVLPDTVITQISTNSEDYSTLPKMVAIALPTILGAGFAIAAFTDKGDVKSVAKYLFVSAVGVLVFVVMLVVNL